MPQLIVRAGPESAGRLTRRRPSSKDEYLELRRAQDTYEVFDGGLHG